MKFDKIRMSGTSNVDFPLLGVDDFGPFLLKSATGLGPPDIAVSIAGSMQEGGYYQGRRAQNRQIVLRVGLQPDWDEGQTPEELRTILYDLMTPKYGKLSTTKLMRGPTVVAQAEGQISKFEISVFAQDPEVQITIDCLSPYFTAPNLVYQVPTKVTEDGNVLFTVLNDGTAPAGFTMSATLQAAVSSPLILSDDADNQQIIIERDFAVGDSLLVDTRPGLRGVWKILAGDTSHISMLNFLRPTSEWIQLYGGNTQLKLNTTSFDWRAEGFGHTPTYWGV